MALADPLPMPLDSERLGKVPCHRPAGYAGLLAEPVKGGRAGHGRDGPCY
ncbi:hypothetical protein [Candidatus Nitrososphaera sp. FF02]